MPKTGIEPVRKYKFRRILSPVRLPVPPLRQYMAPRVGLEPTAYRLTAGCSTIELPWNIIGGDIQIRTGDQGVAVHCLTTWLCRLIKYYLGWIKRFELSVSRATIWRFNQLSYTHHNGRGEGTRTPGPMVPNHVRYQTALHLGNSIQKKYGGPSGTRTPDLPVMSRAL